MAKCFSRASLGDSNAVSARTAGAELKPVTITRSDEYAKCWGIGAGISLVAVASTVFGVHTPVQVVGMILGLPLFIIALAFTRGHGGSADYALMIVFGSLLYGFLSYLVLLVVRRVRSN
jgi:hypothetical protein